MAEVVSTIVVVYKEREEVKEGVVGHNERPNLSIQIFSYDKWAHILSGNDQDQMFIKHSHYYLH